MFPHQSCVLPWMAMQNSRHSQLRFTFQYVRIDSLHRIDIPTEYPICILLQPEVPQYPKTPKSTPFTDASGMALTIGVEMVAMTKRTNATKKSMVSGVAGRNIITGCVELLDYDDLDQNKRSSSRSELTTRWIFAWYSGGA